MSEGEQHEDHQINKISIEVWKSGIFMPPNIRPAKICSQVLDATTTFTYT